MAGEPDIGLDPELLATRLSALIAMHDTLEAEEHSFTNVVRAQTTALWSTTGATTAFAGHYRGALVDLHTGIGTLRARVQVVRDTLIQNAKQMELADANVQARLVELAARLDASTTPTPTPTVVAPLAAAAAPASVPSTPAAASKSSGLM